MSGSLDLIKAVVLALRSDAALVALTGHSSVTPEGYRIGRDSPVVIERTPFVGVYLLTSSPLTRTSDVTHLQRAVIGFRAVAKSQLTADQVADRIEKLLHWAVEADATRQPNTGFWPWPSSAISVRLTRFMNRDETEYDKDKDVWVAGLTAEAIWVGYTAEE